MKSTQLRSREVATGATNLGFFYLSETERLFEFHVFMDYQVRRDNVTEEICSNPEHLWGELYWTESSASLFAPFGLW